MTDIDTKKLRRLMEEARECGAGATTREYADYLIALDEAAPALLSEAEEAKRLREELAALRAAPAAEPVDNPDLDATDFAHPAWWRGHDHTTDVFCQLVTRILDGNDDGRGFNVEPWASVRKRLLALVAPPAPVADGERDRYHRAAEFAAKMAWREDPPNAHQKLTDSERLSAIKYHPDIKALAAAPAEAGRDE